MASKPKTVKASKLKPGDRVLVNDAPHVVEDAREVPPEGHVRLRLRSLGTSQLRTRVVALDASLPAAPSQRARKTEPTFLVTFSAIDPEADLDPLELEVQADDADRAIATAITQLHELVGADLAAGYQAAGDPDLVKA